MLRINSKQDATENGAKYRAKCCSKSAKELSQCYPVLIEESSTERRRLKRRQLGMPDLVPFRVSLAAPVVVLVLG